MNSLFPHGSGGQGASAPIFLFKGDAKERALRLAVERWKKRHPHEVRGYLKEVNYLRATLNNGTGMSESGDGCARTLMPNRVVMMMEVMIPGFFDDGGHELWEKCFPEFNIRTSKLGNLIPEGVGKWQSAQAGKSTTEEKEASPPVPTSPTPTGGQPTQST